MKLTIILPIVLACNVDAFSSSSVLRRTTSTQTQIFAASHLPMSKRSSAPIAVANPVSRTVVTQRERNKMKDVAIDPDYWLSINVALLCPLILWYHPCKFFEGVCICTVAASFNDVSLRKVHGRALHD